MESRVKPTLVILAAGMGSRYGGLKQLDGVGPSGETILDYSIFDAVRAGFGKAVFVIRRDFEARFREQVGRKYEGVVDVEYAFQELSDLPAPYKVPPGRVKPWGTAHAVRAARHAASSGPFAAINADDFYGRDAFARMAEFLRAGAPADGILHFAMVGYKLAATLSGNGSVARGVCEVDAGGYLAKVGERTALYRAAGGVENRPEGAPVEKLTGSELVSMNFWGFSPGLFAALEERFSKFLAAKGDDPKSEWYIPFVVDDLVAEGAADVKVIPTKSSWFGVTYREDRPAVVASIRELVEAGEYPAKLF